MLLNRLPQEIRDECRGDRTISRTSLIEIARKKQERGMITAYKTYRTKQLKKLGDMIKSSPPISRKKDPNDPQTLFDMLDKAMTKLQSTDTSAWTDEAKANFQTSLANLKIEISNHQAL
jgi:ParB family chromosome partitioning protein